MDNKSNSTIPLRVLIVNKFYYRRGGDCVYTLNLERMLNERGHETAVFAMQYPENVESQWSGYFPPEVNFQGSVGQKLGALRRTLGNGSVRRDFQRLLRDFKPDVVHLNNVHSYLSPVLAELTKEYGAKVVWTLHDYKLICPSYSCLRDEKVCEDCFTDAKSVLNRKCMKGSLSASAVAWLEARVWNASRLQKCVDMFICPSSFMAEKMALCGFDPTKLAVLNNFIVSPPPVANQRNQRGGYYCYVGRLSAEKGVETLLNAASLIPSKLLVAGTGPMSDRLRVEYGSMPNVTFLGQLGGGAVAELLRQARFSVVPSEWYENNPFAVIESLCAGTPVLGAEIGGIPELIDADNGMLFDSGDVNALAEGLKAMDVAVEERFDPEAIQRRAVNRFSAGAHYDALIKIYSAG